jgi:hypothetical protein
MTSIFPSMPGSVNRSILIIYCGLSSDFLLDGRIIEIHVLPGARAGWNSCPGT